MMKVHARKNVNIKFIKNDADNRERKKFPFQFLDVSHSMSISQLKNFILKVNAKVVVKNVCCCLAKNQRKII